MRRKIFGKNSPRCGNCELGEPSKDEAYIFCDKKGIVKSDYKCRHFKYDPLKRIPKATPEIEKFKKEDFEIE